MGFNRYFKFLIDVGGYSRSLADVGGYLILVKFGKIVRSVKSSGFLRCGVDIGGNFRLSRFPKFWFRVKAVYYKTFLLIIRGGK